MFVSFPRVAAVVLATFLTASSHLPSQPIDDADAVRKIDAAVAARDQRVISYTVTEHYSVFRNQDTDHPAAQMLVKTTYQKGVGKSYAVMSESGSQLLLKEVLARVLENERLVNLPAN